LSAIPVAGEKGGHGAHLDRIHRPVRPRLDSVAHSCKGGCYGLFVRLGPLRLEGDCAGSMRVEEVLVAPPECAETLKARDLLLAGPKYGPARVARLLAHCRISHSKTLAIAQTSRPPRRRPLSPGGPCGAWAACRSWRARAGRPGRRCKEMFIELPEGL
jgi:hypothetical protein